MAPKNRVNLFFCNESEKLLQKLEARVENYSLLDVVSHPNDKSASFGTLFPPGTQCTGSDPVHDPDD